MSGPYDVWEALFDSLDEPALLASPEGLVRKANRAMTTRLGVAGPSLAGRPVWQALGYADGSRDLVSAVLQTFAATSREMEVPRIPGRTFRVDATPVHETGGRILGVLVLLHDVTERRRLQAQLLQAEKLSAIGGLVSGVAHELNNPLSSVLGFAELCAAAPGSPPELQEQLAIIRDEAKRAAKIVKNLLQFARQRKPERVMTPLSEIVHRVVELMAYEMRTSRIRLEMDLEERLPRLLADPGQLQQVLFNLLQNARQACEEKGGEGRVRIAARSAGPKVTLTVEDNGPGFKPDAEQRLFEPFFTTKPPGKGTGLGLSVCYGIIEEHRGTIRLINRPGLGATFVIELPVLTEEKAVRPSTGQFHTPHGLTILIADDEPAALEFLRRVLGETNTVVAAHDGDAAIAALRGGKIDLVITDMRMPGMNGRELYRFIVREKPELTDRVIFTTGDVLSTDTGDFLRDFRIPTIEKPFAARDVLRAVMQAINVR